jgi:hypothetical protein
MVKRSPTTSCMVCGGLSLARGFYRARAERSSGSTKGASDLQGCCLSRAISVQARRHLSGEEE